MKYLFLLRHAKSSWKYTSLKDFDRPLNNRGMRDASLIAAQLLKRNINLDLIVSSGARRTLDTAKIFADALNFRSEIIELDGLYSASSDSIIKIVNQIENNVNNVLIVCHNPGITNLANDLSDFIVENVPTSGLVGFSLNDDWQNIKKKICSFLFFDYPKKYLK